MWLRIEGSYQVIASQSLTVCVCIFVRLAAGSPHNVYVRNILIVSVQSRKAGVVNENGKTERNAQTHAHTRDGLIHDRQLVAVMAQFGSGAPFAASLKLNRSRHLVHDESQCRSVYIYEFVILLVALVNTDIIRCLIVMIVCTQKVLLRCFISTATHFYTLSRQ